MTSPRLGPDTSAVEVVSISPHGIWLHVKGKEYFLPHQDYPWFKDATVAQIHNVVVLHGDHLSWPGLDVDLHIDSLENPDRYPLRATTR